MALRIQSPAYTTAAATERILVTDDRTLRKRASALGVEVWAGADLLAYLATL